jgi:hypothetical protein
MITTHISQGLKLNLSVVAIYKKNKYGKRGEKGTENCQLTIKKKRKGESKHRAFRGIG